MHPDLEALLALHDLDALIEEAQDPKLQELGLAPPEERLRELLARREEIASRLPKQILSRYEKLRKRYRRGIAPVVGGVCMNCFAELPIAMVTSSRKNHELQTCPSCGIFIYWV
ncbi:hypothetical protein DRO33_03775 [Candidatus Bathyarchaeota archaeon]|nr:MAG: hypothetical protein DRO33_03775 [Candidatus Bathyarchaeota archaeon]